MALERLSLLHLGLPQVIESDEAVFVAGEHELVLTGEVAGEARRRLVIREDRRLLLLPLQVEDADLVVRAPSDKH